MILTVTAFLLAIAPLIAVVTADLRTRRERAAFVDLQHALAARDHRDGRELDAQRREAAAAVYAGRTWPYTPRPKDTFLIPTGIITIPQNLTGPEYEAVKAQWEAELGQIGFRGAHTVTILPQQRGPRRWWQW